MNTMLTYNTNSKTGPVCGGRALLITLKKHIIQKLSLPTRISICF